MTFLSTLLFSVFITVALVPLLRAAACGGRLVDNPGGRKDHERPVPKVGGIAMALGIAAPVLYWCREERFVLAYLAGAAVVVAFGIVDDCKDLKPRWKLLGQAIAALIVVTLGGVKIRTLGTLLPEGLALPVWVAAPLAVLAIVAVTNAVNLADGLDGLAGGICLLIFSCIGYLAFLEEDFVIGLVAVALFGAIFGFLRFNTRPATVFMGDAGSQLLGFSAVTLSLSLTQGDTALSPVLPLLLVGLPVLDTISVMKTRISQGRSPFSADRNHIHHNLVALGFQQGESVVVIYAFQTLLVLSAFMLRFHSDWLLLGGYAVFCAVTVLLFSAANRNNGRAADGNGTPLADYFGIRSLRSMKESGVAIRFVFRALEYGFPVLLVAACLAPNELPSYVPSMSLAFLGLLLAVWGFRKDMLEHVLRLVLYLTIPVVMYKNATVDSGMSGLPLRIYYYAFVLLAFADVAVSKLTKRKEGFKSTPMDFLIIALAVVAPNLPDHNLRAFNLGIVAAQTIVLYFTCEVLMAELRKKMTGLALGTGAALVALTIKGFI